MKEIEINTQAEFDKYWDEDRNYFYFAGNLILKCSIEIKKSISIEGWLAIEAGGFIFSFIFEVSAELIKTRTLPFWRKYYAEIPVLKKFREQILNDNFCWRDLRDLPTEIEKKEICSWDGWHWMLRGQLECFFNLKKRFSPPQK